VLAEILLSMHSKYFSCW